MDCSEICQQIVDFEGNQKHEDEEESCGLLHGNDGGKHKQEGVERHGRNGAMEEHQSERDKLNVESPYKGSGEPLAWRIVQRVKKHQSRKWSEDCWARIFSWFREYSLQRRKRSQESKPQEEDRRQQQRMKTMADTTRKIKAKGRLDANNSWWVCEG